jgi:hypothetical protein
MANFGEQEIKDKNFLTPVVLIMMERLRMTLVPLQKPGAFYLLVIGKDLVLL